MKRTTYIILGTFIGGLVIMIVIIIVASLFGNKDVDDNYIKIGGVNETIELQPCKVIKFNFDKISSPYYANISLNVDSAKADKSSFSIPADLKEHLTFKIDKDTLNILFNFMAKDNRAEMERFVFVDSTMLQLSIAKSVHTVINKIDGFDVAFKNLRRDSLCFNVENYATIENCNISSLNASARSLNIKSGSIKDLYLDCDYVRKWEINAKKIIVDVAHLCGSNRYFVDMSGVNEILWTPKTEGGNLVFEDNESVKITRTK
ncbi:MAG: hypothetical protein RSC87_01910 [Muribaculaceae bacterium]